MTRPTTRPTTRPGHSLPALIPTLRLAAVLVAALGFGATGVSGCATLKESLPKVKSASETLLELARVYAGHLDLPECARLAKVAKDLLEEAESVSLEKLVLVIDPWRLCIEQARLVHPDVRIVPREVPGHEKPSEEPMKEPGSAPIQHL